MTEFDLGHWLGMGVVGIRISMLLVFAPFFSSSALPMRVKAVLTLTLTILLAPVCGGAVAVPPFPELVPFLFREALVGCLLGISVQFVFEAAQAAGQILGFQMGFSLVNVIDPLSQVDTPVLGTFHQWVALLIFLRLEVPQWLLRGVARSFAYVPPGTPQLNGVMTEQLLRSAGGIWLAGVQIAAPALVATMLADVALGFLGKASPHLPVLTMGISVKSLLGIVMLFAALAMWPALFEKRFATAVTLGEQLLRATH
jgi:flagellar biosynthetic protein FliR